MVRLAFEDAGWLNIEIVVSPAMEQPVIGVQRTSELELAKILAATANGTVSADALSPERPEFVLRLRVPAATESHEAYESSTAPPRSSIGLYRDFESCLSDPARAKAVMARWIERQHAGFLHAPSPRDTQSACSSVRPDVAVLDLSVCHELPEFLREVPVVGLRGSLTPAPAWCETFIEKPVFRGGSTGSDRLAAAGNRSCGMGAASIGGVKLGEDSRRGR